MSYRVVTSYSYVCQVCGKRREGTSNYHHSQAELVNKVLKHCNICHRIMCYNCSKAKFCVQCFEHIPKDEYKKYENRRGWKRVILVLWILSIALLYFIGMVSSSSMNPLSSPSFNTLFWITTLLGFGLSIYIMVKLTPLIDAAEKKFISTGQKRFGARQNYGDGYSQKMRRNVQQPTTRRVFKEPVRSLENSREGMRGADGSTPLGRKNSFVRILPNGKKVINADFSTVYRNFMENVEKFKRNPATARNIYGEPVQSMKDLWDAMKDVEMGPIKAPDHVYAALKKIILKISDQRCNEQILISEMTREVGVSSEAIIYSTLNNMIKRGEINATLRDGYVIFQEKASSKRESSPQPIQKREGKINIESDSTSYSYTCDVCEKHVKEQLSRPHSEEEIKKFFIKQCKSCNRVLCKLCALESMCWDCTRQIIEKNDQNYFQYRGDTGQPQLSFDCYGALIKNGDEFTKAMMGVGVQHSTRPFTKRVKQTLWAISQKGQNGYVSLLDIRKEAGDIISLKIVVETLQEMIENYELEAEFDAVQMRVKFLDEKL